MLLDRFRIDSSTQPERVNILSREGYKRFFLNSGKVNLSLIRDRLVDYMTLTAISVLIGEGLPHFGI